MSDQSPTSASERKVREGWEEDALRLGLEGLTEEEIEWLEAPLTAEIDEDWTW